MWWGVLGIWMNLDWLGVKCVVVISKIIVCFYCLCGKDSVLLVG